MDARRITGSLIEVAGTVSGFALLVFVLDWPVEQLVPIAFAFAAVRAYRLAQDRYEFNPGWAKALLGVALAGLGAAALLRPDGILWIKLGLLGAGAWLALDGVCDLRTGAAPRRTGDPYVTVQDAGTVWRVLDRESRSAAALRDAVDLPAERVDRALAELERQGRIAESDGVYAPSDPDRDWDALPHQALARIGRPFRQF